MPMAYKIDHSFDNLVPSCSHCNLIAGDKVFEDVWHKRQYILNKRKKKLTHGICNHCLLPYRYRIHSPSLFLCAECYDEEYDRDYSKRKKWGRWLTLLELAGFWVDAHRKARIDILAKYTGNSIGSDNKLAHLILHKHLALEGYYEQKETM
jgi:hypothetical protein